MGEGIEISLPLWPLLCHTDVRESEIIFGGNLRTPADITVLKIKRYETGLTQVVLRVMDS